MSDTVLGYFLRSHQIRSFNNHNISKSLPQSILLFNTHDCDEPSSLFLTLLVSWGRITTFISIFEGCRANWTVQNVIDAAAVMIAREDWDFLERMLDLSTTIDLISNAGTTFRMKFHNLMAPLEINESGGEQIFQQYIQSGFADIVHNQGDLWKQIDN